LVALGKLEEARAVARQMMVCEPEFRLSKYENDRAAFADRELRKTLISRMRAAGLPD
jgi:hypothetical protein